MVAVCGLVDILQEKIDFCYGYSTLDNLEHELMHCKGYADHPLFSF